MAVNQRGSGQWALRRDRGDRASTDGALHATTRADRDHQGPHQLPLVASGGMMLKNSSAGFGMRPMKISRRTANILLAIGVYMLLTWGTRVFTFLAEFRAGTLVAPALHFLLVVIGLAIGVYLAYLGIKGRKHAPAARPERAD